MALAAGATRQEFVESIRLAILSTGSITIPTTRYGYGLLRARGAVALMEKTLRLSLSH